MELAGWINEINWMFITNYGAPCAAWQKCADFQKNSCSWRSFSGSQMVLRREIISVTFGLERARRHGNVPFVREIPGTLQAGGADFGTTHWTVVLAADAEEGAGRAALERLCHDYWPPLYSFVRRRGHSAHDAQDLVQGFFVHMLANRTYASADPARGKFRAFLLTSIKNFLCDKWTDARRQKRGGDLRFVLLDEEVAAVEAADLHGAATVSPLNEEHLFEQRWAASLAANAMKRLHEKYAEGSKAKVFDALKPYVVGGATVGLTGHEETAANLGIPVGTLRSYLLRMRTRYRELLREEVVRTVAREEDVEEELHRLRQVLIQSS